MKRKVFLFSILLAALMLLAGFAFAEADPIVTSMEISPAKLTGPGTVNVTITISNAGDADLTDPVWLYDPAAQVVTDFGTNGSALLKAGESKTWTGTYDVNQRTLENGSIVYFAKYKLVNESGKAVDKSQSIQQKIELQTAEADLDVKRTISPSIASEGQEVVVRYDVMNTGTVSLLNVTIQEHEDVHKQKYTIPELKAGQTAEIRYPVTMGKKDLTSTATLTYTTASNAEVQTYTVEKQTIVFGEPSLEAALKSNAKGVVANGTVTLTLVLKNTGSVDYSDIRVTDASLGDVFTNQELKAGKTLELTREVTVPETMDYQFNVAATDATGAELTIATEKLTISAVAPEDALKMTVTATPDRTEVFEQPGEVRFTIAITNDSNVDAKNVKVSHGTTELYTFSSIAAGETRTLSRDTALSMPGKYRFTVTAVDPLENTLTFESNEMQIAFSAPTPTPKVVVTPEPTVEPTFVPATIAPITAPAIGAFPKAVQTVLLPLLILAGVALVAGIVLLVVATVRRSQQKKASEAAVDQLERAKRRDYVTPAEEEEEQQPQTVPVQLDQSALDDSGLEELELPHMKYARGARQNAETQPQDEYSAGSYYDDELSGDDPYAAPQQNEPADYEPDEPVAYDAYRDDYPMEQPAFEQPVQEEPVKAKREKRGLFGGKKKEKARKQRAQEPQTYSDVQYEPEPEYEYQYEEDYQYEDGYQPAAEEPQEEQTANRRSRRSRAQNLDV